MRYFLELAYNGTSFHGWQKQLNAISVQEVLENALQRALRAPIQTVAAGRTDTGVHAEQQFVHFDYKGKFNANFLFQINCILPRTISVLRVLLPENQELSARFHALSRSYRYQLMRQKNPFLIETSLPFYMPLDLEKMQTACSILKEYQDFASFCKLHGNNLTTICEIYDAYWEVLPNQWHFHIRANRFLRGMVRAIVGAMLEIGAGKISLDGFRTMIEKKNRSAAAMNAEPQGLFLTSVRYPEGAFTILQE